MNEKMSIVELDLDHRITGREFRPFSVNMERNRVGLLEKRCARCGRKILVYDSRVNLCRTCYNMGCSEWR